MKRYESLGDWLCTRMFQSDRIVVFVDDQIIDTGVS